MEHVIFPVLIRVCFADLVLQIALFWSSISTLLVQGGEQQLSVEKTIEKEEMKLMDSMEESEISKEMKRFQHGKSFGQLKSWNKAQKFSVLDGSSLKFALCSFYGALNSPLDSALYTRLSSPHRGEVGNHLGRIVPLL